MKPIRASQHHVFVFCDELVDELKSIIKDILLKKSFHSLGTMFGQCHSYAPEESQGVLDLVLTELQYEYPYLLTNFCDADFINKQEKKKLIDYDSLCGIK